MRVTLLGTGSADGWPNPFCSCRSCAAERTDARARTPSSALVDDVLLIDCGPTTPHLPGSAATDLTAVEHVLITHGHPDHLHPAFLLSRSWTSPATTLDVWGPPRALDLCRDWVGPGAAVDLHVIEPGDEWDLPTERGTYRARALPAAHAHGDGDVMASEALLFVITAPDGERLLYATDTGPIPNAVLADVGARVDVVLLDETFGDHTSHGTGHMDLSTLPDLLDGMRALGVIDAATTVAATHLSHHNPPTRDLAPRLAALGVLLPSDGDVIGAVRRPPRTLVVGGARSGKSSHAEALVAHRGRVTYVATGGARSDDAEWQERVAAHRARRPAHWSTCETTDVAGVLASAAAGDTVLVDCLALWLTAHLDDLDAWTRVEAGGTLAVRREAEERIDGLVDGLTRTAAEVVLVSNEVGMGIVPTGAGSRLFRDLLGVVNLRVGQACDQTVLVVAGQRLELTPRRTHA